MPVKPIRFEETPAQKAARRKHGKRALEALLNAAARMEKAHLPLVTITGAIGEAWAVAELAMQPTANAAAPWDGWLPDGSTVEVKCRYTPRGSSSITLNPRKDKVIDLLVTVELGIDKQVRPVYIGPYRNALLLSSKRRNGMVGIRWSDLDELHQGDPTLAAKN